MPAILLIAPAVEPLTLAEAKTYLRVEHDDDDALIAALIAGARGHVEARTRRALIEQTWRLILDAWPPAGRLAPALAPLRAVVAARVYDETNTAHELDADSFIADAAADAIGFPPFAAPPPGRSTAGIELDIEAGYGPAGADVPEPLRQAIRMLLAHWYENRGAAAVGTSVQPLPASLDALLAPYRVAAL